MHVMHRHEECTTCTIIFIKENYRLNLFVFCIKHQDKTPFARESSYVVCSNDVSKELCILCSPQIFIDGCGSFPH